VVPQLFESVQVLVCVNVVPQGLDETSGNQFVQLQFGVHDETHCPFWHISGEVHAGQFTVPPHPLSQLPHSLPNSAHVFGVHGVQVTLTVGDVALMVPS